MTAIDFPSSPTNGQIFTSGDKTWTYSTTLTAWSLQTQTTTGPTGATGAQGATGATGSLAWIGYQSGIYYFPHSTSNSSTADYQTTRYLPIYISATNTFDRILTRTQASHAGSYNVRLGIYNNNSSTAKPSTVLLDAGTVVVNAANANFEITISQSVASGWYWLAMNVESTNTAGTIGMATETPNAFNSLRLSTTGTMTADTGCWYETGITGAFATAGTLVATTTGPRFSLRSA